MDGIVRPLKMAAVWLSVRLLPDLSLLHLYPTHKTDLLRYLPQDLASDGSHQRGAEGVCPSTGFPGNS